jgi:hypothetical protein
MFRVQNMELRKRTCTVPLLPIFGYLNNVLLSILDNIVITVLKVHIIKLQMQLKNDRMSLALKKVIGKIQGENLNVWVIGLPSSPNILLTK